MFHSSPPLRLFFLSHLHPEQRAPNMPATPTEAAAAPVPPQLLAPKEKERDTPVLVRSTTAPPYHTTPHHTPQHRTPHAAHNTQHAVHRVGTSLLFSSRRTAVRAKVVNELLGGEFVVTLRVRGANDQLGGGEDDLGVKCRRGERGDERLVVNGTRRPENEGRRTGRDRATARSKRGTG